MTGRILGAVVASAQMELAVIQGTVVDDTGRPVEGATILLRDVERGREISIKSDKSGRFYRRALPGGEYEMSVEKERHSPIKDKVQLVAGIDRRFDFKLAKAAPEGADEFSAGVAAFGKGDYAAAARAFEMALEKAPNLPEVRINLALSYLRLDRTADAVAQLEKAASDLGPEHARVQFQLGGAYLEMKELDKAMAAFERGFSGAWTSSRPASPISKPSARPSASRRCVSTSRPALTASEGSFTGPWWAAPGLVADSTNVSQRVRAAHNDETDLWLSNIRFNLMH